MKPTDTYYHGKYGGYGMPRGPLGYEESPLGVAIGYCPHCGANARETTQYKSVFDCPRCTYVWFDDRTHVERTRDIEDYFSRA